MDFLLTNLPAEARFNIEALDVVDVCGQQAEAFPRASARAGLVVIGGEYDVPGMFDAMEACWAKLELIVAKAARKVS